MHTKEMKEFEEDIPRTVNGYSSRNDSNLMHSYAERPRSTADLLVRPEGTEPGNYLKVTKVTQEKQVKGEDPVRISAFTIENPRQSAML